MKRHDDFDDNNRILIYFGIAMTMLILFIVVLVYSQNNARSSSYSGFKKAQEQALKRQGKSGSEAEDEQKNELAFSFNSNLTSDDLDIWTLPPTGRKDSSFEKNTQKDNESEQTDDIKEEPEKLEIDVSVLENLEEGIKYSPSDFKTENGGLVFYKDGKKSSSFGIELSWKQGSLNMKRIKNSGCEFVLIHSGNRGYASGNIVMDEAFQKNLDSALESGLKTGVIFTSQANTKDEVLEEADVCLTAVRGYQLQLPIFIEIEDVENEITRTDGLSREELTDLCTYFINEVKDSGYDAGLYASKKNLENIIIEDLPECEIMLKDEAAAPSFNGDFTYWQYNTDCFNGVTNKTKLILKFN